MSFFYSLRLWNIFCPLPWEICLNEKYLFRFYLQCTTCIIVTHLWFPQPNTALQTTAGSFTPFNIHFISPYLKWETLYEDRRGSTWKIGVETNNFHLQGNRAVNIDLSWLYMERKAARVRMVWGLTHSKANTRNIRQLCFRLAWG